MESVTGLSVSVIGLWETMSGVVGCMGLGFGESLGGGVQFVWW